MRLYAYLGKQLAKSSNPAHQYQDWITTYSSDEFEPLANQLETIVDQHSPDTALTRSTYRYAMTCERDFFQAAWDLQIMSVHVKQLK